MYIDFRVMFFNFFLETLFWLVSKYICFDPYIGIIDTLNDILEMVIKVFEFVFEILII